MKEKSTLANLVDRPSLPSGIGVKELIETLDIERERLQNIGLILGWSKKNLWWLLAKFTTIGWRDELIEYQRHLSDLYIDLGRIFDRIYSVNDNSNNTVLNKKNAVLSEIVGLGVRVKKVINKTYDTLYNWLEKYLEEAQTIIQKRENSQWEFMDVILEAEILSKFIRILVEAFDHPWWMGVNFHSTFANEVAKNFPIEGGELFKQLYKRLWIIYLSLYNSFKSIKSNSDSIKERWHDLYKMILHRYRNANIYQCIFIEDIANEEFDMGDENMQALKRKAITDGLYIW